MEQIEFLAIGIIIGGIIGFFFRSKHFNSEFNNQKNIVSELQQSLLLESNAKSAAQAINQQIPLLQTSLQGKDKRINELQTEIAKLMTEKTAFETKLESEKQNKNEQQKFIDDSKIQLLDTFKALSADSLNTNNQTFLQLAKESLENLQKRAMDDLGNKKDQIDDTLKPIKVSLEKFNEKIQQVETERVDAYSGIKEQFEGMKETQEKLKSETASLVKALRIPHVRGRWGEMQLRRTVEMAGMIDHCDFIEQESVDTEEGRKRPDLVVKLPGGKNIVIDSKAVIASYLEAAQSEDDNFKKEKIKEHAKHIRDRVLELSKKSYWEQFKNSPEFVVLYLPGESFFSSALETDPMLIEQSVGQKVIIATPTTLIALLKAVSFGWKQAALAENAREISDLGKELYKRISDMAGHFSEVGNKLGGAVASYNKTVGSFETRVLVSARKFKDLKATDSDAKINQINSVDKSIREIQASGLIEEIPLHTNSEEEGHLEN